MDKSLSPARKRRDLFLRLLLTASGILVCGLLAFLTGYLLWRGLPFVSWNLLGKEPSMLQGTAGLLPHIASTLYVILTTLVLVLPRFWQVCRRFCSVWLECCFLCSCWALAQASWPEALR